MAVSADLVNPPSGNVATLEALLEASFGVRSQADDNPLVSAVQLTDTIWAKNNPSRVALSITNLDAANSIYVRPLVSAAGPLGILVTAGQTFVLKWSDDFILPALEWHAIAVGGVVDIYVLERIIY